MVLPLMNMPLMVPATIMPLAGAGAAAPKGDSNSWGRPRPWPLPNTFSLRCAMCALSSVAMGLSGKMVGCGIGSAREMSRQELAFCNAEKQHNASNLFEATPCTSFQVGYSKNSQSPNRHRRPGDRARSTPSTTRQLVKNQPVFVDEPTSLVLHTVVRQIEIELRSTPADEGPCTVRLRYSAIPREKKENRKNVE